MKKGEHVVFAETDNKVYWRYENGKEDKSRRKAIPRKELGQIFNNDTNRRSYISLLGDKLRPSSEIYELVGRIKERQDMIAVVILLTGIWASGFLAAKGLAFWSLLTLVVSFVLGVVLGGKKDAGK